MKNLFNSKISSVFYNELAKNLDSKINALGRKHFDNSTIDELSNEFYEKHKLKLPELKESEIYQKKPEDISVKIHQFDTTGTKYSLRIPFIGDPKLFELRPKKYASIFPYGKISSNEIQLEYANPSYNDGTDIDKNFKDNLELIKNYILYLDPEVKEFNKSIKEGIKKALKNRKLKLDNDDNIASNFGYPLK